VNLRRTLWVTAAVAVGAVAGWLLTGRELARHREDLFHPQPLRRLAALAWLEESADAASLGLVRDYLRWEPRALLRGRAERLLRRLEASVA
jgi:hypothetical protein